MTTGSLRRPRSEAELNRFLKKAYDYACKSDYPKALEICDWLIREVSTEMAGHRKRAAVREHMGDLDGAICDLQHVVAAESKEPADFYTLGVLQLQRGFTAEAVVSFSKAIEVGDEAGFDYYRKGSLLFRADAYLKLCEFEKAIADCSALPHGYQTYVGGASGMRTREEILSEAIAAVQAKHSKHSPRRAG